MQLRSLTFLRIDSIVIKQVVLVSDIIFFIRDVVQVLRLLGHALILLLLWHAWCLIGYATFPDWSWVGVSTARCYAWHVPGGALLTKFDWGIDWLLWLFGLDGGFEVKGCKPTFRLLVIIRFVSNVHILFQNCGFAVPWIRWFQIFGWIWKGVWSWLLWGLFWLQNAFDSFHLVVIS